MTTHILDTKGFAAAVIDALASNICVVDKDSVIVAVNRAWTDFGAENPPASERSGIGTRYLDVCHTASGPGSEEAEAFADGVQEVLDGKTELFQLEYPCHSPDQNRWFLGRVTPLRTEHHGAVISHLNITDRKLIENDLARLAATDPLTGLPNRRFFYERAEREIERVRRFRTSVSVIMFDLDHFKAVNDEYGHALGDESLRTLSRSCSALLRQVDVLARYGGEEFVVLIPGTDEATASVVAEKLRQVVSQMEDRFGEVVLENHARFKQRIAQACGSIAVGSN